MRSLSGVFAVFLLFSVGLTQGYAAEIESCREIKIIGYGHPNKMQSMANMNAIIQWIAATKKKHGEEFAQWHYASEGKVSCRQAGTELYICSAEAKPCKPRVEASKGVKK